jgi:hypothetical protein
MSGDTVSIDLSTVRWLVGISITAISALIAATAMVWRERRQIEDLGDAVFGANRKTGEGGLLRAVFGSAPFKEVGVVEKVGDLERDRALHAEQAKKHGELLADVVRGFDVMGSGEHALAKAIRAKIGGGGSSGEDDAAATARRQLIAEQEQRFDTGRRAPVTPYRVDRPDPRAEPVSEPPPLPPKRRI